jgi:hypothetical protein
MKHTLITDFGFSGVRVRRVPGGVALVGERDTYREIVPVYEGGTLDGVMVVRDRKIAWGPGTEKTSYTAHFEMPIAAIASLLGEGEEVSLTALIARAHACAMSADGWALPEPA